MDEYKELCLDIEGTILRESAGCDEITLTVDCPDVVAAVLAKLEDEDTTYSRPICDTHLLINIDRGTYACFNGVVCPCHALPPLGGSRIKARGFLSSGSRGSQIKILMAVIVN
jgi:hypothetical protein